MTSPDFFFSPKLMVSQKVTRHVIPAKAGIYRPLKTMDSAKASLRTPAYPETRYCQIIMNIQEKKGAILK
jgi:hypothetical protein